LRLYDAFADACKNPASINFTAIVAPRSQGNELLLKRLQSRYLRPRISRLPVISNLLALHT